MKDLLLNENGDLFFTEQGDVVLTDSVKQAIIIRLRWILNEWRINPKYGIPYYEEVFIKNPNAVLIKQRIEKEILSVDEVQSVESISINIDNSTRIARVSFTAIVKSGSIIKEEVDINV